MSLFNLGHRRSDPTQDVRNSLGDHAGPGGVPCSKYRMPGSEDILHVIYLGDDAYSAIGECPVPDTAATSATSVSP
ncbi:hypothetical protein FXF51_02280 [Nonomuraea sp. PA05]|uniref:hypothetical protein n=1 Tax=Nonomuraea sp. PA05 TaxID=2604466 RepID=UPI0011D30392|nr:hypothetical protein [Nonomuraea sp. PA05]TYB71281.1 hypothetical protein FXF51_02280 [Nonomuraea sp. PA05]